MESNLYSSHSHRRESSKPSTNDSTFILPAYSYKPPTKISSTRLATAPSNSHVSDAGIAGFTVEPPSIDDPDPHDFYRQFRDEYRRESDERYDQPDIVVATQGSGMTTPLPLRPTPSKIRSNGVAPSVNARVNNRSNSRPSPSPINEKQIIAAKSTPQLANAVRLRQSSLQDLVNKFNSNTDEVPPLPGNPSSRRGSSARSSIASQGSKPYRVRTPSLSSQPGSATLPRPWMSQQDGADRPSSLTQRKKYTRDDTPSGPAGAKGTKNKPVEPSISRNTFAKSAIDLHSVGRIQRPLFGELVADKATPLNPGYGILRGRVRRGSEGSMHSPNPMFSEERPATFSRQSVSPTDWYTGEKPTLDGINLDKPVPSRPLGMHRRSRSDFSSTIATKHVVMPLRKKSELISPSLENSVAQVSPISVKRNSQSRIPLSARRMSTTSESGSSSPSLYSHSSRIHRGTHANLQKSRSQAKNTNSGASGKPPLTIKSPRRRDTSPRKEHPGLNPLLKAYISSPPATKSPPLRSSRPRQPVSMASTSASRARASERALQGNRYYTKAEERKTKPLPELGNVDFKARRERIQEAFTKTVREKEVQEGIEAERRRVSQARASQYLGDASFAIPQVGEIPIPMIPSEFSDARNADRADDEAYATPAEEPSQLERGLRIETSLIGRSALDLEQEDSPTLGIANEIRHSQAVDRQNSLTPPSEAEPASAMTAASVNTFFDNEPQDDLTQPSHDHQTILNQVMALREASPATTPGEDQIATGSSISEKDDIESIEIMLGETPVLERIEPAYALDGQTQRINGSNDLPTRWSMNSWTSSNRSGDDYRVDRDEAQQRNETIATPRRDEGNHISLSTIASSYTQGWSPGPPGSLFSARTTMDSEAYNNVNKVLDQYHDQNISSEAMTDIRQGITSQAPSPNIARAGGWDPKKVTQLYMQQLAKTRQAQASSNVETLRYSHQSSTSQEQDPFERNHGGAHDASPVRSAETLVSREQSSSLRHKKMPSDGLEVPQFNRQRASLTQPSDWMNTSPSYLDWIHHNSSTDTPVEEKPPPISKDTRLGTSDIPPRTTSHRHKESNAAVGERPQLPEIVPSGDLGIIGIHVISPNEGPSVIPSSLPISSSAYSTPPRSTSAETHNAFSSKSIEPFPHESPPAEEDVIRSLSIGSATGQFQVAEPEEIFRTNSDGSIPEPVSHPIADSRPASLPRSQERKSTDRSRTIDNGGKPKIAPSEQKRLTRRRNIIKELVDTEHSFGQDMKVVDDIYKGTSNGLVISAEDVKILFGNSDQIVTFSTNFLDALKQAAKSVYVLPKSRRWKNKRDSAATSASGFTDDQSSLNGAELGDEEKDRRTFVGDVFNKHLTSMEKVYADYLKNHEAATQKLQQLQKTDKVQVWLKECRNFAHDLTTAWDLDSLLVKPVQRILKYPLLLKELCEVTPENHPDFTALDTAAREMVGVSVRINEMKKRADIVEQVAGGVRNRKNSDGRNITKVFRGQREKLKVSVGLSETVQDREYTNVAEKFGLHFFQLQVVMRDVEMYTNDIQIFVNKFNDFALAIEGHMEVGQIAYPEIESKWRKFRMSMREMQQTALPDHVSVGSTFLNHVFPTNLEQLASIRRHVIDPMASLLKLHDGPQKLMQKRSKRLTDYARFRGLKERGDKPDKKTSDQGEQFIALNATLKEELPRMFAMTGRLVEACLSNFVLLQLQWQGIWRRKLSQAVDVHSDSPHLHDIINAFQGDFRYTEAQALSLGICNGSILADAANLVNFLSPTTTLNDDNSPRQSTTITLDSRDRTLSQGSSNSPTISRPEYTSRHSDQLGVSHLVGASLASLAQPHHAAGRRIRASSTASTRSPATPEIPGGWRNHSNSVTPTVNSNNRPSTSIGRTSETPSLPRLSVDTPDFNRLSTDSHAHSIRPPSTSTYQSSNQSHTGRGRQPSPSDRYSGFFNSSLPMSDKPPQHTPPTPPGRRDFHILWVAVSVYEFSIDQSRGEAGYPYLTYVAGEVSQRLLNPTNIAILIDYRSSMSLAKRENSGSQRIRTTPRNGLAGYGISILRNLPIDDRYRNHLILLQLSAEKWDLL